MSPRSNGVTNVELSRRMISWNVDIGDVISLVTILIGIIAGARKAGKMELKLDLLWRSWTGGDRNEPMDVRVGKLEHDVAGLLRRHQE